MDDKVGKYHENIAIEHTRILILQVIITHLTNRNILLAHCTYACRFMKRITFSIVGLKTHAVFNCSEHLSQLLRA